MAAAPQIFERSKEMKIKATYIIEKEYEYDLKEWLNGNPDLTEQEFQVCVKNWISEDFDRISNRAANVIGDFKDQLTFTKYE